MKVLYLASFSRKIWLMVEWFLNDICVAEISFLMAVRHFSAQTLSGPLKKKFLLNSHASYLREKTPAIFQDPRTPNITYSCGPGAHILIWDAEVLVQHCAPVQLHNSWHKLRDVRGWGWAVCGSFSVCHHVEEGREREPSCARDQKERTSKGETCEHSASVMRMQWQRACNRRESQWWAHFMGVRNALLLLHCDRRLSNTEPELHSVAKFCMNQQVFIAIEMQAYWSPNKWEPKLAIFYC